MSDGKALATATVAASLPPLRFTEEQRRTILDTCCGGASESDARALMAIAEARGLNPMLGDCYFVERYDNQRNRKVWSVQASIDSFRSKAEETGLYCGQDEPEYEYDGKGAVSVARVRVYRRDWPRPCVGVARWSEYVQLTRDGKPTRFWANMPHSQLAKCAETLALRKAFPRVFARVYGDDEMAQADRPAPDIRDATVTDNGVERPYGRPPAEATAARTQHVDREEPTTVLYDAHVKALVRAGASATMQALRAEMNRIAGDAKAQRLTLDQVADLRTMAKQQKLIVEANMEAAAKAQRQPTAEALGDDFPDSYNEAPKPGVRIVDHGERGVDRIEWPEHDGQEPPMGA